MSASFDNDQFLELAKKWPATVPQYLYKHFYKKLVHLSLLRTNSVDASEDIVQDVLVDIWKRLDELVAREGFLIAPYLFMLVKKKSITYYYDSMLVQNNDPDALDYLISSLPSAEDQLFDKDVQRYLRMVVNRLPRRERRCLQLKYFDGISNESIATELGVSKKTVERWLTNGLRLLRQRLARKK